MGLVKFYIFPVVIVLILLGLISGTGALQTKDCEVCIKTLEKFTSHLHDTYNETQLKDPKLIEDAFRHFCTKRTSKERTFCYYLGGNEDSATGILPKMSLPLSWGVPVDKVCEKLNKLDTQICELHYNVEVDVKTADLNKLKVRELKQILSQWDETCHGCAEKRDYIQRIEDLKHKHIEL